MCGLAIAVPFLFGLLDRHVCSWCSLGAQCFLNDHNSSVISKVGYRAGNLCASVIIIAALLL